MHKNIQGRTPVSRWTPLAIAISAALAGHAHAQETSQETSQAMPAQQKPAADKTAVETKQLDTVVVTGTPSFKL